MPWTIVHHRDRELLVRGAECGQPLLTRDPVQALRFNSQAEARAWIGKHVVGGFGELALTREPGSRDTRRGTASHYGSRTNP